MIYEENETKKGLNGQLDQDAPVDPMYGVKVIDFGTQILTDHIVLKLADVPIGRKGGLVTAAAKAGVGKSNMSEAIAAALIAVKNEYKTKDTMGFEGVNVPGHIIHLDTERSDSDSAIGYQRLARRFDLDFTGIKSIPFYNYYNLTRYKKNTERLNYMKEIVQEQGEGCSCIIIDGIGDLCTNTNDAEEVSNLVGWLVAAANEHQILFVMTLHENPRDQKSRGHLGSELWRKAESSFHIRKDVKTGFKKITTNYDFGKVRGAKDTISQDFEWSNEEEYHMFVAIDQPGTMSSDECFREALKFGKAVTYTQMVSSIEILAEVKNRKAKQLVKSALNDGLIERYSEMDDANKKRVWYRLIYGNE